MVRICCDVCKKEKGSGREATDQWILGYDLEVESKMGVHRSITFLDRWYDMRVLELGAIHLCSETCKDKYLQASHSKGGLLRM